jgi:hypothetical protein
MSTVQVKEGRGASRLRRGKEGQIERKEGQGGRERRAGTDTGSCEEKRARERKRERDESATRSTQESQWKRPWWILPVYGKQVR